ncbi:MAG TPA: PAS domain S-box protein [Flavisolibacter sp.]|jgi:PAS domain S-box-containing protein|nr:PAS domain S-box protein [Flavisolibacter sp.]
MKTGTAASLPRYDELLFQNVSEIIVITDLAFHVQAWNKAAENAYGIAACEAIGKSIGDLVQFRFLDTTQEESIADLRQKQVWKGRVSFTNREGETFYFLQTVKYIFDNHGSAVGILALGHDITARQRAEEQLVKSEQFYRTLIADSLDLTMLLNAKGEITFSTPAIKRILGYTEEEVLHTNAFQYIHPEDLGWALQSFEREVEENPEIKFIVVRIQRKSGEWLWCMVRGHNMLNNPNINAVVIYIHDDTPRKLATEALLESEKRFRNLIRDLQIGVLLQNADGSIEMTNNAMCRMFDVNESVLLGGKIWELYTDVTHEDGRRFLQEDRPSYRAMQTKTLVKNVVMGVWHPKQQERIWIIINADPILDEAGNVKRIVCSFTNITERKKLERKSFAEKMAHQRQLAQATIDGQEQERLEIGKELHDNIGQQLTTIKLFLDLAKATADEATQIMLNRALRNVTELINEVRSISRSLVPPTLKDLGFIDSVNDLIESLRCTQSIAVELDYYEFDEDKIPDNKKLALYRIIQEQLNNIIKHARAQQVAIILRLTAHNVLLQIKDDGIGFELEKVKRGLGLSNIHNRAELFGGKALFTSSPGNGCEVNVCLPHNTGVVAIN